MQKLVEGIHRFKSVVFEPRKGFFEGLARGQKPETLFITCSDSRINPNLLTQTEPGELFIMRNAGNIIPPYSSQSGGEVATIEYAVVALQVRDIIVCGHSYCGAMHGLLHPEALGAMPAVASFLAHAEATRRIIRENYTHLEGERLLTATVEENVLVQLEHLATHPSVAARLNRGDIRLHGWVYKIETAEVFTFDPNSGQFVPLGDDLSPPERPPVQPGAVHVHRKVDPPVPPLLA